MRSYIYNVKAEKKGKNEIFLKNIVEIFCW